MQDTTVSSLRIQHQRMFQCSAELSVVIKKLYVGILNIAESVNALKTLGNLGQLHCEQMSIQTLSVIH